MQTQTAYLKTHSALFDPDLPTAKEVMGAICCVATQYAINPTLDLAKLAASLARKLTAPEYAETKLIAEIANRMLMQWNEVVSEHLYVETQLMPSNKTMQ